MATAQNTQDRAILKNRTSFFFLGVNVLYKWG